MQFNFHSLANNQDYSCIEYSKDHQLINENPSFVKFENKFLFDVEYDNYLQIVAYQRDNRADQKQVHSCPVHVDKTLRAPFNLDNKSEDIMGNFARIYKNKGQYNGVLFTTSPGLPCIFAIPETDFKGLQKTATDRGCSTMTLQEDEFQKELYHKGELHKIHEKLQQHHRDKNINDSTMQIIRRMILPNRNL